MSLFRKVLGIKSAEEWRTEADASFEEGDFGVAKLHYERALDKCAADAGELRGELQARVAACCDKIAEQRIAEGDRQRDAGHLDIAAGEYEGALEVAEDAELQAMARGRIDQLERTHAVFHAAPEAEATDEERLAALAGSWEPDQADEYEALGADIDQALVALMREDEEGAQQARELLEKLVEQAEEPRYIWLELGRARLRCDDTEGGAEALRRFLGVLDPDEGGESRLAAHIELAHLADERGEFDAAVAEYQAAIDALEEHPGPYLWLGRFLREKGHPAQAVDVIEAALAVMDSEQPDWQVLQELGLAQAEAGKEDEAVESLEQVLRVLTSRLHLDFPPETALTLARLQEKRGHKERAADLYRQLTMSSDRANHAMYYREGARVLQELGFEEEARRMRERAAALEPAQPAGEEQPAGEGQPPGEEQPPEAASDDSVL